MKKINLHRWFVLLTLPVLAFGFVPSASALTITDTSADIRDDFVVGPAKTELFMKRGDKVVKSLSVVNRTDREQTFTIEVEDFTGSKDLKQVVVLLGNDRGPYSLRDYIKPEQNSFRLKSKQRAVLDVTISIPNDAEPGGHYGSVLVSSAPSSQDDEVLDNKSRTISRIGALYFVRVEGKIKEDGRVSDFRMEGNKSIYERGPFIFELLFENNSSVHLTPNGTIEVKNMLGRKVKDLEVAPFFSLPDSLRAAVVSWETDFAFGRYTATANINRGYKESPDQVDVMTISFWVLPWKLVVGFLLVVIIVAFILRRLVRSFEIKRKR